jgi:hypothetical protein
MSVLTADSDLHAPHIGLPPAPQTHPPPLWSRFIHVSSAGVTRPNRPGINVDQEPPAVKLNDALGGLLTYKLAGEDAVSVLGHAVYTVHLAF